MKPEALEKMEEEELDHLVEKLIFGRRPRLGIIHRIRDSWLRRYSQRSGNSCVAYLPKHEVPEYSGSYEGMGLIIEKMQGKGYAVTREPNGNVGFTSREETETEYAMRGWSDDLPMTCRRLLP